MGWALWVWAIYVAVAYGAAGMMVWGVISALEDDEDEDEARAVRRAIRKAQAVRWQS
jgi:hypothetical protein